MIKPNRRFFLAVFIAVVVLLMTPRAWAQSAGAPASSAPMPAKVDQPKTSESASSETPAIDPDVKQWFLEQQKPRLPYNLQDVDVLTGKTREAERLADFPNYGWQAWSPAMMGYGSFMNGRWDSRFSSRFFSPGFSFWGTGRGARGGAFFFGPRRFRPFAFGNNMPRFGHGRR